MTSSRARSQPLSDRRTEGFERVAVCRDPGAGYTGVIAVHSVTLGPAVGGTRLWSYPSLDEAIEDALRLSRGMTYKNAVAGLPFGGGKAVILGPPPSDPRAREALFRAHGRFLDELGGQFVTGEDVGTSPADMAIVAEETDHVAGLESGMGDPSPFTARGVFRAMEAAARLTWGGGLDGRAVAIQGLGNVGMHLAEILDSEGATLVVTDIDWTRVEEAVRRFGARAVEPGEVVAVKADVLAPCALGGVLDDAGVERVTAAIVCGGANNQLARPEHGTRLAERGIVYVPDFVANAGGVISGSVDIAGWDRARMVAAVEAIAETTTEVLELARDSACAPHGAAERIAEKRLRAARRNG